MPPAAARSQTAPRRSAAPETALATASPPTRSSPQAPNGPPTGATATAERPAGPPPEPSAARPPGTHPPRRFLPAYDRISAGDAGPSRFRRLAPFAAGAVILAILAAVLLTQLAGGSSQAPHGQASHGQAAALTAPSPSQVTVAVLNGAGVSGLGARVGAKVRGAGFSLGTVGNAPGATSSQTTVEYANGASRDAALVAGKLGVTHTTADAAGVASRAGGAPVVVVVGADMAGSHP